MLRLPNYKENDLEVVIMKKIATICPDKYFTTVKFLNRGKQMPVGFELKLSSKMTENCPKGFKFIYKELGWRLLFTCIPTDIPIERSYSLVNDFIQLCKDK